VDAHIANSELCRELIKLIRAPVETHRFAPGDPDDSLKRRTMIRGDVRARHLSDNLRS